jgi:uncharacterized Tic20 family protein
VDEKAKKYLNFQYSQTFIIVIVRTGGQVAREMSYGIEGQ